MGVGRRPKLPGDFRVYGLPRRTGLHHLWNDSLSIPLRGEENRTAGGFDRTGNADVSVPIQISKPGIHERPARAAQCVASMVVADVDCGSCRGPSAAYPLASSSF